MSQIEAAVKGATSLSVDPTLESCGARLNVLIGAGQLKRVVGQINVVIHALGILLCLPRLLEPGETIQYVSLGAGNTGRAFDLETDRRVAEFKFIQWQGGSESIRHNSLFKDFFLLAEHEGPKRKYLYVLGTEYPLKGLNGGRALQSVLSKEAALRDHFRAKYGDQYATVRDYFKPRRDSVIIQDVSPWLEGLIGTGIDSEDVAV